MVELSELSHRNNAVNIVGPIKNDHHIGDDILKYIFLHTDYCIFIIL